MSEATQSPGGASTCQGEGDAQEGGIPEGLTVVQASVNEHDRYPILDEIRRVNEENPGQLFRSAVVEEDHLLLLAQAGVIKVRGRIETNCAVDPQTGEVFCVHNGEPGPDCRLPACKYHALMRQRIILRLAAAYAAARRKHVGL